MSRDTEVGEVDWSHLMEQFEGDLDVVCEIVDAHATEVCQRVDELRAALAAEDAASLRRAAHSLGGAMRTFGLEDGERSARGVQQRADAGEFAGIGPLVDALVAAAEALLPKLRHFVASGGAPAR